MVCKILCKIIKVCNLFLRSFHVKKIWRRITSYSRREEIFLRNSNYFFLSQDMYLQFSVEWIWRLSQKKTCSYYPTSCSLGSPCMSYALFLIGLKSRGPIWTLRYLLQRPPTNPHLEMSPEKLKSKYCICVYKYLHTA